MPLQYDAKWKFGESGIELPLPAHQALQTLIERIVAGLPGQQSAVETFKQAFGSSGWSSELSWAWTDLERITQAARNNAARYIDQYWSAIEQLQREDVPVPDAEIVNALLAQNGVPFKIAPPHLVYLSADVELVHAKSSSKPQALSVGGLELHEVLGFGGYGTVHRATRTTSVATFEYAVKLLDPSPFVLDKSKALARFQREVKAISMLQHRAIVSYIDAGVGMVDQPYIVMPLIRGHALSNAGLASDPGRVFGTFSEILRGLNYAHELGVLHRDLKCSNVMVRETDEQALMLDFGCAYLLQEPGEDSLTTTHVGSAGYIPSEVLANPKLRTPGQDIFACGVMLYEVVAGRRPDPSDYAPLAEVDERFAEWDSPIRKALAPASQRYATAAAFRKGLMDAHLG